MRSSPHGVEIRFYIDPETGEPHIYRHNVSEEEVEGVSADGGKIVPEITMLGLRSVRQRPVGT